MAQLSHLSYTQWVNCFVFLFWCSLSQSSFFFYSNEFAMKRHTSIQTREGEREKNNECPRVSLMLNMCRFRCPFNFRALNCEINTFMHTNKNHNFFYHTNSMIWVFRPLCVSVSLLLLLQLFCLLLLWWWWMSSLDCLRFEYTRKRATFEDLKCACELNI